MFGKCVSFSIKLFSSIFSGSTIQRERVALEDITYSEVLALQSAPQAYYFWIVIVLKCRVIIINISIFGTIF